MSIKEFGAVILSPGCNNNCVFCKVGEIDRTGYIRLKLQKYKAFMNLKNFKKKGITDIEISGSDPIEVKDITQFIRKIKKNGFKFVQLSTHGKRLSDASFLDKLIESGIDKIRIPLYGSNAEIHDSITRSKGSFDATIEGIKKLLEKTARIQVQVSSLIVKQNKNDLIGLIKLMSELNIRDFYFTIPCVPDKDYSYYIPLKDLGPYVKRAYDYAQRIYFKLVFMEIPFCVFGKYSLLIKNRCGPPDLGKYCQPPKEHNSGLKDLPSYRLKKRVEICNKCRYWRICDGFFVNDVDKFGVEGLRPLTE